MLIPKKMSAKKILQYGALMSLTLGATGYLILKNFVAPGFFSKGNETITVHIDTPVIDEPENTAGNAAAEKTSLFEDEKFIKLKDYMNSNFDIEGSSENIGKKNPFEPPKKPIQEIEQPAEQPGQTERAPEAPTSTTEQQFISL